MRDLEAENDRLRECARGDRMNRELPESKSPETRPVSTAGSASISGLSVSVIQATYFVSHSLFHSFAFFT